MPDEQRFPCFVCNESFAEKWEHHEHIHSYSHQKKVSAKGRNTRHTCICCQTTLNSIVEYADHIGTEGHIEALKEKIAGMKSWEANEKRNRSNMQRPAKRQPHHRQNQNWNRWDLQPRGYRKWEHQRSSGSDNYMDLNANSGRSNATHDNDERNWKYPFGFQYPYNQPTPYNNHINYHHRNPALTSVHQHPNSQQPFSATPSTSNSYSSDTFVSSSLSLNTTTDSHSVQSTTGVHDFMDRKVSEQSHSLEGTSVAQSPCVSLGHNSRSIRSASQVIGPVGSSAAPEPSYKNRSAEHKEQCSIFSNASPTRPDASSDKSSKPSSRPTTPVGVNPQASAAKQTSDYDSSKKSSKTLRASTSSDKSAQLKGERAAKSASRSADSSVVGSSIGDSNIASSKELSVNPPVASISGETLRKVKKEPGNDLQTDRLSNNNNKIKKKQGNLQGLLQGRSSSRHLQYQLDKAVKMRRTVQGRNYNIENEAIASGFPDSCELESLKEGDAGEIEALLEGVEGPFQDQANQSADATSSTSYQESSILPMIGKRRSIDQQTAATSDGTSGKRQRQTETAGPSPVLKQTKKLKKTALPTNLSIKSRKIQKKAKTVTPQKQQKTLKASGKQNAVGKTKVKKTSTKTAGVSDELRQSAEVSSEESSSFPAKTQTEEESVISQLLVITVREEKIRQELPTLEDSINAMTAKKKNLLEELKKLEEEIQSAKVMRDLMNEEECNIRKSRLDILTKAKRTNLKASTVIQQADTTSTISDQPLNTQYLGGFITSDTADEQKIVSQLQERVQHMSQGSDGDSVSRQSDTSSKGLEKFEKKIGGLVQTQRRKSLYGKNSLVFEGHKSPVQHLVIKSDYLYSSSGDETLRRFDLQTGACLNTYSGHGAAIKCFVVLSKHQEKMVIYSADINGLLLLFDVDTSQVLKSHNFGQSVNCMVDNWGYLYIGLHNGDIVSYSIEESCTIEKYQTGASGIVSMCTAQEGARRLVICGSYDSLLSVRDVKSGLLLRLLPDNKELPRCMAVDASRPYVYVGASDTLRIYNYDKAVLIKEFPTAGRIRSLCLVKDSSSLLFLALEDGKVYQFNTESLEISNLYQLPSTLLAVTAKKGKLYIGDSSGRTTSIRISHNSHTCKIGSCFLPYADEEQLLNHVFTTHLTEIVSQNTCPWQGCTSREHHKSTGAFRQHIVEEHLF